MLPNNWNTQYVVSDLPIACAYKNYLVELQTRSLTIIWLKSKFLVLHTYRYCSYLIVCCRPSVEIAIRAPPLNKRRHVYLDATVLKFGFRLEVRLLSIPFNLILTCSLVTQTYGRSTFLGDVMDTVVYTVTQGTAAFLAGLYPGDVILEVEGEDVSNKNCNDLGKIIASYKEKLQV